jgi:hypothetical protein
MRANVIGKHTPKRRPRGRAALALLPGVFALMLVGVSSVAAAAAPTPTPTPTPTTTPGPVCHHHHHPLCPTPTPSPTATPTATPSPTGTGNQGSNGGGSTPTPTPAPTSTPKPTSTPAPTSKPVITTGGSSSGSHTGGTSTTTSSGVGHPQIVVVPTPFAPLTNVVTAVTSGQGLDAARIPPVEALTPLSGLDFGNGLNLGPILLLIDMLGIGLLVYLVRTRWLNPEA